MQYLNKNNFLFNDVSSLKGVGSKLKKYLKNKKIEKIKDLLWDLPYDIICSIVQTVESRDLHKLSRVSHTFRDSIYFEKVNTMRLINHESYIYRLNYLDCTLIDYKNKNYDDYELFRQIYDIYYPYYIEKINENV